ncbi:TPA: fibronectin-binding protein FnbA [Staphylococcus aureus]|uniref:fibrinogen-binding adhesin SdrG C-terminal domain-containing protein n=1 Tax=Staphylococcus aureus TaxID=1280 RepID=UPI001C835137|nr:fibrinogen-binding adhesin SdrG C-terminal domain-containing protein [Staphylococcus aureus]MBX6693568.1 fibronectin-binding protein FnbA [Staphylococcus aureus]MCJ8114332.1 fibronectin-binding protein FnbA [Staphylococcus aureus]MCQ1475377.1 fibronectin-binding protein FnbA [Staphylococcus aureus]HCX9198115.1 fibronectin-binding protein FnbA [Staphylococcus aureus]HCX9518451.1 fibronectin-binding protein FnbA [Staphylococcus aureus]
MKNNLRYGIRKHKLGAASVFLGTMIVVGMGQDKEAAASEQKTTVEENGNSATDNKVSETQTTATNVNTIEETQSYNATVTEQPSNATQVTTEEAPNAVQAPQTAQPANVETVKEEEKPQVKETTQPQDNSGNQRQVDLTPKKVTQNQGTETQVEVAQPRTASESKPRVTRSADVAEAKEASDVSEVKGTDVTSKVTVTESSIEGHNNTNKVEPHAGQRAVLKYKLKFENGLHQGDYFDFTLSNNVNTHGVSTVRKVPDILNGSLVMATGKVLGEGKIRYTFTDYINNKVNVTANLEINLFIDPKTVQDNGNQKITSMINDHETEKTIPISYNPGVSNTYANINGSIETFNKADNKFTHVAYIIPKNGMSTESATITGTLMKGSNSNGNSPTVKIFEVLESNKELPKSVYANINDTNTFKDVTSQMKDNLTVSENGSYSLNIENLNKTYVVHYSGEYLSGSHEVDFRTQMTGHPKQQSIYYYNHGYTLTWDNGLVLYSNKANGDGKYGPIVDSNNFEFSEDSGNGSISGQYDAKQIIETEENQDNTPLDIDYHTAIDGEGGYVDGYIETIEETDSSAIDIDYHTAVDSEAGHVGGYTESSEESNPIDFEESTHENSKHHADVVEYEEDTNPGGGQVTTESNLVEFDEESTKGIVTGAVSDHTTVEDTKEYTTESNLIELVDELPEEHGQAQGPIEEITENNHHISHSGLGTENGHGNYGVIEEIEENSHVDIKSELGYEGGQNSGNQSFEEDTEEDKPKYEQGGNIVDIDFDSVPQIHGQNKGDQSFEEDTEKDKPKYEHGGNIIDIDFDSVPHIHGFNKHTEIIEEDTNKDKPNYQFGGHNIVDFEEDTLPKVSGQNEGQQTIEEDTTPPTPPTPPTPEVPSEPETPTPPTPEVPSEPETPTPPTPEVPAEPGKPVPPAKEEPKKPSKPVEQGKVVTPVIEINEKVKAVAPTKKAQSKKSELPETGGEESTNKGMLFGGLFSILGLALLRRNKKNNKA